MSMIILNKISTSPATLCPLFHHIQKRRMLMKTSFFIPNISCKHCVMTITRELQDLDGVTSVEGDVSTKHVEVTWNKPATESQILDTLDEIGYPAENI